LDDFLRHQFGKLTGFWPVFVMSLSVNIVGFVSLLKFVVCPL
jgi:hypothetical protein